MKKLFLIFLFFSFLPIVIFAETPYRDEKLEVNLLIPDDWQVTKNNQDLSFLSLINSDQFSVINFTVYPKAASANVKTLQTKFAQTKFDGWINLGERYGAKSENSLANVQASYVAVYAKKLLLDDLSLDKQIVAEYYYQRKNRIYVITISTKQSLWPNIQTSLKTLLDSFWLGSKSFFEEPRAVKSDFEWEMIGRNSQNQNILKVNLNLKTAKNIIWEFEASLPEENFSTKDIKFLPLFTEGTLFFNYFNQLYSINIDKGVINWTYETKNLIKSELLFNQGVLYLFLEEKEKSYLYGLVANNGSVLFKYPLKNKTYSAPIIANKNLVFYDGDLIKVLEPDSAKLLLSKQLALKPGTYPVASGNYLFVVTTANILTALDLNDLSVIWEKKFSWPIIFSPAIFNNKVFLLTQESSIQLTSLDFNNGNILWSVKDDLAEFNQCSPLAIADTVIGLWARNDIGTYFLSFDQLYGELDLKYSLDDLTIKNEDLLMTNQNYFFLTSQPIEQAKAIKVILNKLDYKKIQLEQISLVNLPILDKLDLISFKIYKNNGFLFLFNQGLRLMLIK